MTARRPSEPAPLEALRELLGGAEEPVGGDRSRTADRTGRRVPPPPAALVGAIAGAAASVCAVALGLVVLLWLDDAPRSVSAAARSAAASSPSPPAPPPAPSPSPSRPPVAAPVAPAEAAAPAPPPVVPVTVLNNSRRSGLAARGAAQFAAGGWPVAATGNFRGRIPVTTVYYDPGLEVSARAFAARFHGVVRVRPRFAGLPARGVVVVLTREFAASW